MPIAYPFRGRTDVFEHLRLARAELPEVVPPLTQRQTVVAARGHIGIRQVRAVIFPKANGADVPVGPSGKCEVIAARALLKVRALRGHSSTTSSSFEIATTSLRRRNTRLRFRLMPVAAESAM